MNIINVVKDFSKTPGARYRKDGPYSGEEFRESILEKYFIDKNDNSEILINLDGAAGYATSFLEESFGGLARKYGIDRCLKRLTFITSEDPLLEEEIVDYVKNCKGNK